MKIKVIFNNGVAEAVLSDGNAEVEIISIDDDYADREALIKYAESLRSDPDLKELNFTTANFEEP